MRRSSGLVSLAALAAGLVIAACGSSSSTSATTSGASASAVAAPTDAEVHARVELAKCLRAHGVDVPDSAATGTAGARAAVQQLLTKYSQTQLQNAISDCHGELVQAFPQLNLSSSQLAQRQHEAVAYVQCLRSHGVNLPDPVGSGLRAGIIKALSNVDVDSPAFKTANTACANLRPARLAGG
jgi:hypothetical protein